LTDRGVYVWKHHSSTWAKAIYNKETDTFTGIYSWGEHEEDVSLHHIGIKMARRIGRESCNAWAEFKTANGESIERLDIEVVAPIDQRIEEAIASIEADSSRLSLVRTTINERRYLLDTRTGLICRDYLEVQGLWNERTNEIERRTSEGAAPWRDMHYR
jgi:hypothetical protein